MKKLMSIAMAMLLVLGLAACSGDVTGTEGNTYKTKWFDFTVDEFKAVTEYDDYSAADGYVFMVVTVTETNTWSQNEAIPMGDVDFQMTLNGDTEEYLWCLDAWSDTMMPGEFYLEPAESATYDLVFHIPEDTESVQLIYLEVDAADNEGNTFTINHTL